MDENLYKITRQLKGQCHALIQTHIESVTDPEHWDTDPHTDRQKTDQIGENYQPYIYFLIIGLHSAIHL